MRWPPAEGTILCGAAPSEPSPERTGAIENAARILSLESSARTARRRPHAVDALAALARAVRVLGREDRAETMVAAACGHLRTLLGATACMISRVDDGTLREVAVAGPAQWSVEENLGYLLDDYPETKAVLEKGEARTASLSDGDVDASEAFVLRSLGMHVNLMLPLQLEGRPWGLIEIFDAGPRVFGLGEVGLAQVMAGHLEALLAKLEQADQSQHLYYETLASLSNALEAKDGYTRRPRAGGRRPRGCGRGVGWAWRAGRCESSSSEPCSTTSARSGFPRPSSTSRGPSPRTNGS